MTWYHDDLSWGGWVLMTIAMLLFWALVILAVVALFRGVERDRSALQILDERFARGEIDAAEYQTQRAALQEPRQPPPAQVAP